jgi:hypothetical protein
MVKVTSCELSHSGSVENLKKIGGGWVEDQWGYRVFLTFQIVNSLFSNNASEYTTELRGTALFAAPFPAPS